MRPFHGLDVGSNPTGDAKRLHLLVGLGTEPLKLETPVQIRLESPLTLRSYTGSTGGFQPSKRGSIPLRSAILLYNVL